MFPGGTQWESNYLVFYLYSRFGCSKRRKIHTICVWRATLLSVRLNAPRLCTHSWNRFCMMTNPKRNKRLNIPLVGVNQANISLVVLDKWIRWARTMKSHFDQHMEMVESYFRLLTYHVNNRWHNTSQDHFCSVIDNDKSSLYSPTASRIVWVFQSSFGKSVTLIIACCLCGNKQKGWSLCVSDRFGYFGKIILHRIISVVWLTNFLSEIQNLSWATLSKRKNVIEIIWKVRNIDDHLLHLR